LVHANARKDAAWVLTTVIIDRRLQYTGITGLETIMSVVPTQQFSGAVQLRDIGIDLMQTHRHD
jgi:uncharacterized protein (DUF1015 family)